MASPLDAGSLTFSLDVGGNGAASLRTAIMEKLSEFMGSYTDDVLAEYVVVLVGHGKHRKQAINDLKAFLGDQSEAFVTWLWDHLGSNMHLYTSDANVCSPNSDMANTNQLGETECKKETEKAVPINMPLVKEKSPEQMATEGGRLINLRKDNAEAEMKKEMGRNAVLTTRDGSSGFSQGRTHSAKRSRSPDSWAQAERSIPEKQKRFSSPSRINATRRLLQSAVREAVAPNTGHTKPIMNSMKRTIRDKSTSMSGSTLREESSIEHREPTASTAIEDSEITTVKQVAEDQDRPIPRPSKRAMPAIMMAMRAAAAAAEDASKSRVRHGGNIWERLGKKTIEMEHKTAENSTYVYEGNDAIETRSINDHDINKQRLEIPDAISEGSIGNAVLSDSVFHEHVDQSASSQNMYEGRRKEWKYDADRSEESFPNDYSGRKGEHVKASDRWKQSREESVTVEYRSTEGSTKEAHKQKESGLSSALPNSSQKIVNISVNVNTWKHGSYEKINEIRSNEQISSASIPGQPQEQMERFSVANASTAISEEENANDLKQAHGMQLEVTNRGGKQTEMTKETQKIAASTLPSGSKQARKPDDAESRTIFITNIHFAASKESLTAHFASCGDMGRVVMLTDGATGQPKGSAYIEFKSKDAADRALALNESPFFSRPLKVVRKDAAIQAMQEMSPLMHSALMRRPIPRALRLPLRGRFIRGSPYLMPRRFPAMPAVRPYGSFPSLQWRRDAAVVLPPPVAVPSSSGFPVPTRPPRSLSYVRASNTTVAPPGLKANGEAAVSIPEERSEKAASKQSSEAEKSSTSALSGNMDDVEMEQA